MLKCNNPKCGYDTKWGDRYRICPKCGFVMEPYKPYKKKTVEDIITDMMEDTSGDK